MKNYIVSLQFKKKRLFGSKIENLSIGTKAQSAEEAKINALKDAQHQSNGFTLSYCEIQEVGLIKEFFPLDFSEPKAIEPKFEFFANDGDKLVEFRNPTIEEIFPLAAKHQQAKQQDKVILKRGRPPLVKKPLVKKTLPLVKDLPKISSSFYSALTQNKSSLSFHSALINKKLSREDLSNGMRFKIKNLEKKEALHNYYISKDRIVEACNLKKEIDKMDSWISRKITLFSKDYYEEQKKVAYRLNEIKKSMKGGVGVSQSNNKDIRLEERYNTLLEIYNPKSLSKANKKVKSLLDDCIKKIKK